MNIDYRDPWVLVLNITVIIILTLLIIPTLLNTKEKLGVRLSFSAIFMVVAVNCLANLALCQVSPTWLKIKPVTTIAEIK